MAIYVKVNDAQYPATITGRLNDKDWDGRESKAIRVEMKYEDAVKIFVDDVDWFIIQDNEEEIIEINEETGEEIVKTVIVADSYDNSDYSIAGDITDHRDGTVTVKMGKLTAQEMIAIIEEVL